eukprot:1161312-Pelagomonas_calceolata.AAC.9
MPAIGSNLQYTLFLVQLVPCYDSLKLHVQNTYMLNSGPVLVYRIWIFKDLNHSSLTTWALVDVCKKIGQYSVTILAYLLYPCFPQGGTLIASMDFSILPRSPNPPNCTAWNIEGQGEQADLTNASRRKKVCPVFRVVGLCCFEAADVVAWNSS